MNARCLGLLLASVACLSTSGPCASAPSTGRAEAVADVQAEQLLLQEQLLQQLAEGGGDEALRAARARALRVKADPSVMTPEIARRDVLAGLALEARRACNESVMRLMVLARARRVGIAVTDVVAAAGLEACQSEADESSRIDTLLGPGSAPGGADRAYQAHLWLSQRHLHPAAVARLQEVVVTHSDENTRVLALGSLAGAIPEALNDWRARIALDGELPARLRSKALGKYVAIDAKATRELLVSLVRQAPDALAHAVGDLAGSYVSLTGDARPVEAAVLGEPALTPAIELALLSVNFAPTDEASRRALAAVAERIALDPTRTARDRMLAFIEHAFKAGDTAERALMARCLAADADPKFATMLLGRIERQPYLADAPDVRHHVDRLTASSIPAVRAAAHEARAAVLRHVDDTRRSEALTKQIHSAREKRRGAPLR